MRISNQLFVEALQRSLSVTVLTSELGTTDFAKLHKDGYDRTLKMLQDLSAAEPYVSNPESLPYDKKASTPITQLAYTIRDALDGVMLAIERGDEPHAVFAANTLQLAMFELTVIFDALKLPGLRAQPVYATFVDPLASLPAEFVATLTAEEKAILPEGFDLNACPTEEEQPFCNEEPCPGCDVRRKVLSFRKLIEDQKARPH